MEDSKHTSKSGGRNAQSQGGCLIEDLEDDGFRIGEVQEVANNSPILQSPALLARLIPTPWRDPTAVIWCHTRQQSNSALLSKADVEDRRPVFYGRHVAAGPLLDEVRTSSFISGGRRSFDTLSAEFFEREEERRRKSSGPLFDGSSEAAGAARRILGAKSITTGLATNTFTAGKKNSGEKENSVAGKSSIFGFFKDTSTAASTGTAIAISRGVKQLPPPAELPRPRKLPPRTLREYELLGEPVPYYPTGDSFSCGPIIDTINSGDKRFLIPQTGILRKKMDASLAGGGAAPPFDGAEERDVVKRNLLKDLGFSCGVSRDLQKQNSYSRLLQSSDCDDDVDFRGNTRQVEHNHLSEVEPILHDVNVPEGTNDIKRAFARVTPSLTDDSFSVKVFRAVSKNLDVAQNYSSDLKVEDVSASALSSGKNMNNFFTPYDDDPVTGDPAASDGQAPLEATRRLSEQSSDIIRLEQMLPPRRNSFERDNLASGCSSRWQNGSLEPTIDEVAESQLNNSSASIYDTQKLKRSSQHKDLSEKMCDISSRIRERHLISRPERQENQFSFTHKKFPGPNGCNINSSAAPPSPKTIGQGGGSGSSGGDAHAKKEEEIAASSAEAEPPATRWSLLSDTRAEPLARVQEKDLYARMKETTRRSNIVEENVKSRLEHDPNLLQLAHPALVEKLNKSNQLNQTLQLQLEKVFEKVLESQTERKKIEKERAQLQHRFNLLDHELEVIKRQYATQKNRYERDLEQYEYFEALLKLLYDASPSEVAEMAAAQPPLPSPARGDSSCSSSPPTTSNTASNTDLRQRAGFLIQALHQGKLRLTWLDQLHKSDPEFKIQVLSQELIRREEEQEKLQKNYNVVLEEVSRLKDQVQELKGNIRVFARLRPVNSNVAECAVVPKVDGQSENRMNSLIVKSTQAFGGREVEFGFDRVFGMRDSQECVYSEVGPLLEGIPRGFHLAVFAYGQTGSGKTYTLDGTKGDPGILRQALQDLVTIANRSQHRIVMSVVEIYNETVRDLLNSEYLEADNLRGDAGEFQTESNSRSNSSASSSSCSATNNNITPRRGRNNNLQANEGTNIGRLQPPTNDGRGTSGARSVSRTPRGGDPRSQRGRRDRSVTPVKKNLDTSFQSNVSSRRNSWRDHGGNDGGHNNNLEIRGSCAHNVHNSNTGDSYSGGNHNYAGNSFNKYGAINNQSGGASGASSSGGHHCQSLFGSITVPGLTTQILETWQDAEEILAKARQNRHTGATALNDVSSRSHCIFSVGMLDSRNKGYIGALHIIDLAGSERTKISKAEGVRLTEAKQINKSLSALGDCLFALEQKAAHVPFRNSKLSYLLSDVLSQSWSKILLFANVNPAAENSSESFSTLSFAKRISNIEKGRLRVTTENL